MATQTDPLPSTPLFAAVQTIFTTANASDQTVSAGGRVNINAEAANLCRRAADELESRA